MPLRALSTGTNARSVLDRGLVELGLQVYAEDAVWTKLTYRQLLEEGALLRAKQLEGKPSANQRRYNAVYALRVWMQNLGLSGESYVGVELLAQFDEKLGQARSNIQGKTTRGKFSSEMRRWATIHKELLKRKGLPADFSKALETAIERSGLNAQRVTELADGCDGIITGWVRGVALPSKSSLPLISRIEDALKLEPSSGS